MAALTDWWVVGRAEKDPKRVLVECQVTGRLGYALGFTEEQWERAGGACRVHLGWDAYRWNPKWGEIIELTASVA